ncbi:glycoside hydrolase family 92 protein [Fulvivirga sp. M361]|uniref:GH92 family glycosyl hydrolase n=1 Tax=Fulvivirga sp. M361 TaxID=2594266 RepID=UPI00117ADF6B|nr:GH92 family glycosyl hydrolase [Fulvivirga sp. M361]TRX53375.1 glycoside hydrolase family 92 protein [Fulvivirga sp. M361]
MIRLLVISGLLVNTMLFGQPPTSYVNPFIGTSNYGATHPGSNFPHAMVSVTPFNVAHRKGAENKFEKDSEWHSRPYVYENKYLTGFSHINLSGVGCPEAGSILLMPTTDSLSFDSEKYGSTYSQEKASPGYYSNRLDRYDVLTELTSTKRSGISRYTFPEGRSNILLNLGLGLTNETGASLKIISPTEVEGFKTIGTFCYNAEDVRPVYFVAKLSKAPTSFGAWKKMPKYKAVEADWVKYNNAYKPYEKYMHELAGENIGAYFTFDTKENEVIEVKVGISYVSIANARKNLNAEQPGFEFEDTRVKNESKWNELLGRVRVDSDNKEAKTIFYTALYHTLIHPNLINDVNGDYPAMGSHKTMNSGKDRYSVFSLWDTYRNVHPFLSLVYPELQSQMVNTMVDMYKENQWLPKWELFGMETDVMVGDPGSPVITDTYLRGIRDFDVASAFNAMKKASDTSEKANALRPGIDSYNTLGYVAEDSTDVWGGSVSTSLEYYIADWNIAQLAKELDYPSDYKKYKQKSLGYKNLFDKSTGMLRPRFQDGSWLTPFNPEAGKNFEAVIGYVEGNAWQYRFYVPHDIEGLIKLLGGNKKFGSQLQLLFDSDNYDMANEPDITYPYLFNYLPGQEYKSQQKVRELIDKYYTNTPGGIPGNDDTGTLSTWLVFSMLGIYPVCPGDMSYAMVSPYFDKVNITLNSQYYPGSSLIIKSNRPSHDAKYISSIRKDGRPVRSFFIEHKDLINGGVLEFDLTSTPSK